MTIDVARPGRSSRADSPGQDTSEQLAVDAAEVSDSMATVMRAHSSLKAKAMLGAETELGVMILLAKLAKEGARRAGELAEAMCADPSTVSRQVASLVRGGLIERRADPADGRASLLVLTTAGRDRVEQFAARRSRTVQPIIASWSADERQTFIRLLRSYSAGLDIHRDEILAGLTADSWPSPATTPPERSQS